MIHADNDVVISTIETWLAPRLNARGVKIVGMQGREGAGFSAETFYIDVEYVKEGVEYQKAFAVRCQNRESDLFVGASIELPYRVMEAVGKVSDVPVPEVIGLEMDPSVLGEPFLIMTKMPGRIVQQSPNYNVEGWVKELPVSQRGMVWRSGLEVMAKINSLDWQSGFEFLANPKQGAPGLEGYLAWVKEWYDWTREQGEPIPLMDTAMNYLLTNKPEAPHVSVLWGDPNSSNILFDADLGVGTVLDWEMASLGTAEVDLAWWLFFDNLFSAGFGVERMEGLPSREESIAYYESQLGRKVENMEYYDILATFRMSIVGVRAVDRQIKRNAIPATTTARSHQPIMAMLAAQLGEEPPIVGEDFAAFSRVIGM
ncbi:MAG: phosphotransferase family protein [Spongiibacteraceae bacterium]